jgi:hypothetical protein
MPRAPIDVLPQRELTLELKFWIDRARHSEPGSSQWVESMNQLAMLVLDNPTAARRSHVLHNLGATRRRWLCQMGSDPSYSRGVSIRITELLRQMGCP